VEASIAQLLATGKSPEAERLKGFLAAIDRGEDHSFYGELASHPLFLRLILDDVARNGMRQIGRAGLLWEWSLYKVMRDIAHKSRTSKQGWEFEPQFANQMMLFMEDIAMHMTKEAEGTVVLAESIDADTVRRIASLRFPRDPDVVVKVALNSLLIPHKLFENSKFTMHFVYRIFQEFFLACHLVRNRREIVVPGSQVAELVAELERTKLFGNENVKELPI
jgi:hypothetical protein